MDTLRVLVTDDELGMRLGVERTLRRFTVHVPDVNVDVQFTVDQAEDGEAALEKIRRQPPDILLLDHKMPGMSGLEVLEAVDEYREMLVVMITAYASIETAVAATKRGAYDFLAKPFTPDELKSTIRKAAARIVLARQARKLAEERREVRFQFIRVLGHELKAPLAAVEGYLNLLEGHTLGEDLSKYDEMIVRSRRRLDGMRKLIHDLLDMTRIESGRKERQLAAVDVAEVAQQALDDFAPDARQRRIEMALDGAGPLPMQADRGELEMMLNNLVSNAIKYNREGGRVDVRLQRRGSEVLIEVADTGIGMRAGEVERLFGEFVRIRNAKTKNVPGSGLGLTILKKLSQLYDGEISVESEPDAGSKFTVRLIDRGGE